MVINLKSKQNFKKCALNRLSFYLMIKVGIIYSIKNFVYQ